MKKKEKIFERAVKIAYDNFDYNIRIVILMIFSLLGIIYLVAFLSDIMGIKIESVGIIFFLGWFISNLLKILEAHIAKNHKNKLELNKKAPDITARWWIVKNARTKD